MSKLTDIKFCHVCKGFNLTPIYGVFIPDIITDVEIRRDTLKCEDCDTLHYIDSGRISYEFSVKIDTYRPKQYKENE